MKEQKNFSHVLLGLGALEQPLRQDCETHHFPPASLHPSALLRPQGKVWKPSSHRTAIPEAVYTVHPAQSAALLDGLTVPFAPSLRGASERLSSVQLDLTFCRYFSPPSPYVSSPLP